MILAAKGPIDVEQVRSLLERTGTLGHGIFYSNRPAAAEGGPSVCECSKVEKDH